MKAKLQIIGFHAALACIFTMLFFIVSEAGSIPSGYSGYFNFDNNLDNASYGAYDVTFYEWQTKKDTIDPVYNISPNGRAFTHYWKPYKQYAPDISVFDIAYQSMTTYTLVFNVKYTNEDDILLDGFKMTSNGQWVHTGWNDKDTLFLMGIGASYFHTYGAKIVSITGDTTDIAINYGFIEDTWSTVVIRIQNTLVEVWVDGNQVYNNNVSTFATVDNSLVLYPFGFRMASNSRQYYMYSCLASQFDELYIYDYALTAADISSIFKQVGIVKYKPNHHQKHQPTQMYSIRGQKINELHSNGLYIGYKHKLLNVNNRNIHAIGN